MYDNLLLVFTLSGNVAHSFLIKSLKENSECVQKILIVNLKMSFMMSISISVTKKLRKIL